MTDAGKLWRQIADTLLEDFAADGLEPGARLPTEAALAARFAVNRHTVRRAIDALVRAGRVRVEQGRGAFLLDDRLRFEIGARTRFSERIRGQNRVPDGRVLLLAEVAAPAAIAAALDVAEGAGLLRMERVGLADEVPVSLADHYFALDRLPGLQAAFASDPSISAALTAIGFGDYRRRSTRVSARMPTAAEAEALRMARSRPLLVCENVNVDRQGRPIEFALTRHPGERLQLVFEP